MPQKKKTQTLAQVAYDHIVGRIMNGELVAGDFVDRWQLADKLGMSRAPVVSAIEQLAGEGYLEIVPRKGTRIRPIRPEDLRGQLIVRMALECQVARLCCGQPIRDDHDRLLALAEAVEEGDTGAAERPGAETAFHTALAELAQCTALYDALARNLRLGHFMAIHFIFPKEVRRTDRHPRLLESLTTDDPDTAERAMRDHIIGGREQLLDRE